MSLRCQSQSRTEQRNCLPAAMASTQPISHHLNNCQTVLLLWLDCCSRNWPAGSGYANSTGLDQGNFAPLFLFLRTLPLSGRQGACGGGEEGWRWPVHSKALLGDYVMLVLKQSYFSRLRRNASSAPSMMTRTALIADAQSSLPQASATPLPLRTSKSLTMLASASISRLALCVAKMSRRFDLAFSVLELAPGKHS